MVMKHLGFYLIQKLNHLFLWKLLGVGTAILQVIPVDLLTLVKGAEKGLSSQERGSESRAQRGCVRN